MIRSSAAVGGAFASTPRLGAKVLAGSAFLSAVTGIDKLMQQFCFYIVENLRCRAL